MFKPHEQRLIEELNSLDERLFKLIAFFDNPIFAALSADEQKDLREQASVMRKYQEILQRWRARFVPSE